MLRPQLKLNTLLGLLSPYPPNKLRKFELFTVFAYKPLIFILPAVGDSD